MTPKQRMLNAYRGVASDRVPAAPELWYYYPAKLLGVDMIEFQREVPFHLALKTTFEAFECEGWGVTFAGVPNENVSSSSEERWLDGDTLQERTTTRTPEGVLTSVSRLQRGEPSWVVERPLKDLARDLPAWEVASLGGRPEAMDVAGLVRAWEEVGESYLLEGWCGVPFFDFYAGAREGGFQQGIFDLTEAGLEATFERLREKHEQRTVQMARVLCERTPVESLFLGCSWSCNSLLGPHLWRRWDKPGIKAVCDEVHRHGRLLHLHFHGRCLDCVPDFAELGLDCVCPFERPPGGDIDGLPGLRHVAEALAGRTTMNGNVHTVDTLIRGTPVEVHREVSEILQAFEGNPRLIVGTGDQVGRETPEENLRAMIEEVKATG